MSHAIEASRGVFLRAASSAPRPSSTSSRDPAADAVDAAAAARLQAEIEAREAALVHSLLASTDRLPQAIRPGTTTTTVLDVARGAAALSRAAGLRSAFRALQVLKRAPGLLSLTERELARRALALKLALPSADVGALVSMRPALLLLGPAPVVQRVVGGAADQISALMPGIPWQRKLSEGGTVYWSFSSLLDGSGQAVERARREDAEADAEAEGGGGGGGAGAGG